MITRRSFIRKIAVSLVVFSAVFTGGRIFAQEKHSPLRLFLIGNSFSQNATRYLPQLSKEGGHELVIGRAELGGCPLQRHWTSVVANEADPKDPAGRPYNGKSLRELLSDGKWDVVTIQQYSFLSSDIASYSPYAQNLYNFIRKLQPGAEVVFHQTWAYRSDAKVFGRVSRTATDSVTAKSQREMFTLSRAAYHAMAKQLGIRIIPSGDAFQRVNDDRKWGYRPDKQFVAEKAAYPSLPAQSHSMNVGYSWDKNQKLAFDPNHASDAGCYLAGMVWYAFLYNEDPGKLAFKPEHLSDEFAGFLKETAKRVAGKQGAAK
ncbi:DUF4886 domain-containing protein [Pedobacter sp. HMF7056]|uniref:DUF4886 domain-containing protein n=2 Tax=Hufsiella ginkgonis TaxID=2695274 RepID=A0A7K1Y1Q9_9SPHI|nr:DUF4886 domain-containing protein [Hufsiella ginkgonis]